MKLKVKESGNIMFMSTQNKDVISNRRLDSSWAQTISQRTKFYSSRVLFVLSSFLFVVSTLLFFSSYFIASLSIVIM